MQEEKTWDNLPTSTGFQPSSTVFQGVETLVIFAFRFRYTPLLPASTMGSIEERSIVTPIRRVLKGKAAR